MRFAFLRLSLELALGIRGSWRGIHSVLSFSVLSLLHPPHSFLLFEKKKKKKIGYAFTGAEAEEGYAIWDFYSINVGDAATFILEKCTLSR